MRDLSTPEKLVEAFNEYLSTVSNSEVEWYSSERNLRAGGLEGFLDFLGYPHEYNAESHLLEPGEHK